MQNVIKHTQRPGISNQSELFTVERVFNIYNIAQWAQDATHMGLKMSKIVETAYDIILVVFNI